MQFHPKAHFFERSNLIDRNGAIRLSHIGGGKLEEIEKQIEALLGKISP